MMVIEAWLEEIDQAGRQRWFATVIRTGHTGANCTFTRVRRNTVGIKKAKAFAKRNRIQWTT